MTRTLIALAVLMASATTGFAASVKNLDADAHTLTVTDGGNKSQLQVAAGETVEFCPKGCFVTLPNGDREALTGTETLEISGGIGRIK